MRRLLVFALLALTACAGFALGPVQRVPNRITHPRRDDARLAVLWVGHATVLVQMDDRFVLTDPLLTDSVGQLTQRLQEPGIDPANLPPIDAVLISHMHFDHLSLGSLDMIEPKVRRLFVPRGGLVYIPNYAFDARELATWQSFDDRGMRITAVPVKHVGYRYGVDAAWMTHSFTGYVIEYHGLTVYFSGDTAYDAERFRATAERFPHIDLALLPIAPIHPRSFMEEVHCDPVEALQSFADLGARTMVPIHYDTLVNGFDARGEARMLLESYVHARGLDDRVKVLPIGGQAVIAAETAPAPETPRVVAIEASCDIILPGPFRFRAGSSDLGADSAFLVDGYTSLIRTSCLKPERVAIVGYLAPGEPDAPGLAQARADAVSRVLVARGVDPSRLETHASATPYPGEAPNVTDGRAEIRILHAEGRDWLRWDGKALVPVDP